jgi:protein-tyrosine phosphatase
VTDRGTYPQFVELDGCFNFRDLGGYRTSDGGTVVRRMLYRSDSLHRLTAVGLATFAGLGIATVLDLRTPAEVQQSSWAPPRQWGGRWLHLPLLERVPDWSTVDPSELAHADFAASHYWRIATSGATTLRDAIETFATPGALPAVFHCTAGKDRTGVLAAVVLRLLGVPAATAAEEYALSEVGTAHWEASLAAGNQDDTQATWGDIPPSMLTAKPETMLEFLRQIDAKHGSIHGFAHQLGLSQDTIVSLRRGLISPAAPGRRACGRGSASGAVTERAGASGDDDREHGDGD